MAIDIGPIAKPHIWLEGDIINGTTSIESFSQRIDHAKDGVVTSSLSISGVTNFNQEDILTFSDKVRIVIQPQIEPKFRYYTKDNSPFNSEENVFEGSASEPPAGGVSNQANYYSETYFTINGKDPVRGKSYLYKYKDFDDQYNSMLNPSDGIPASIFLGIGFILGSSQTGSDLITLKARTFFQGKKSRVAIAKFKIARDIQSTDVQNGVPPFNKRD